MDTNCVCVFLENLVLYKVIPQIQISDVNSRVRWTLCTGLASFSEYSEDLPKLKHIREASVLNFT